MAHIVGVDIGGTFTDAVAVSVDDGVVVTAKSPTTPADLTRGLFGAVDLLAEQLSMGTEELLAQTVKFVHGTTQTSNIVFTWEGGAHTGLITTAGFADELPIMRARGRVAGLSLSERRHLRTTDKPPQIVPRERIVEVAERVDCTGAPLVPLSERAAEAAVRALLAQGVEAIAVSLLWSPEYPDHELLIEQVVADLAPEVHVSLSHRLAPVIGEYERATTTVVNAFVAPTVERYLDRLAGELEQRGLATPLLVLQASGGVSTAEHVVPVNTIESGPAAGMVAVRSLAQTTGHPNIVATDVGGTTFKVGLLADGRWSNSQETIINQYTLMLPMIDLVSIGAGGGSIAWLDGERLRIGPQSAGSDPGPACYGWGGTKPTVTDADLVLGFLNPDGFGGGQMRLRVDLAERAIREHVADELFDGDVVAAAAGIRRIVDSQMGDLVRKATIERGHDPRSFVLAAYGGAGPLHAAGYARGLGVERILVPTPATVYSAYGAAASDIRQTLQRSVELDAIEDPERLEADYRKLDDEAKELLYRQGVDDVDIELHRWADMRYARQLHDVRVSLDANGLAGAIVDDLARSFRVRYQQLYGSGAVLDGATLQVLRIGLDAIGLVRKPEPRTLDAESATPEQSATVRPVYWWEDAEWVDTPIHRGEDLLAGHVIHGPALIEQPGTTVAVPSEARATTDRNGNITIDLEAGRR